MSDLNQLDLEQERKRVRSVVKTPEGREALRKELGYNFLFNDDALADKQDRPLVSILCPTRDRPMGQTNRAAEEMIRASMMHAIITPFPAIATSVVHWSRNQLLVNLRRAKKPTDYVLLMDDDMVPPRDALIKMLAHDVDIVAGMCTVRQDPPMPNIRAWFPGEKTYQTIFEWTIEGLMEVGAVGSAFMLVKTPVFDQIGEYTMSCRYEREQLGYTEEALRRIEAGKRAHAKRTGNEWWFEFMKQQDGDGEYGEDISFCYKATQCGYKIFVDTTIQPGHVGHYAYTISDYLNYQKEVMARQAEKEAEKFNPEVVLI